KMTWGDQTLVGNSYTKQDAIEEHGRFRRIDEKIVAATEVPLPAEPAQTPARQKRKVFEVPTGATRSMIQDAINQAARIAGQRPVVHLPMGEYRLIAPLVIPVGCDVQLVGDGAGETATRLTWAGRGDGPVLLLQGPSRATLRDIFVNAGQGR